VIPLSRNSRWRRKQEVFLARVVVFEGYLSRLLLCFPGRQIKCHYCYLDHNSYCCHIPKCRRKSTTTILNLRSSTCKRSKCYVQNWKYFRFVVAILKDLFAVDSKVIYLASMSSTSPETYDYSLTPLWCEQHLPNWNYFRFLSAIFISRVTATPGDANIIATKKVMVVMNYRDRAFELVWRNCADFCRSGQFFINPLVHMYSYSCIVLHCPVLQCPPLRFLLTFNVLSVHPTAVYIANSGNCLALLLWPM